MAAPAPSLLWLFFSFKGRIARQSFVLGAGFLLIPQILIIIQLVRADEVKAEGALAFWALCLLACVLFTIWSLVALFLKRLHDLELPGMLCLIVFVSGINFLFFLFLALMPSKQNTNEHGPPPFSH